jgi:predicted nucleic acid-binding protein
MTAPAEIVLDASVAAKLFFPEAGSDAALRLERSGARLIAPDLIFVEMASITAKHVRRRGASYTLASAVQPRLRELLHETVPLKDLAEKAFDLAAKHGFSAYDGAYLALARARRLVVITADVRFARKAAEVGLADHVALLATED